MKRKFAVAASFFFVSTLLTFAQVPPVNHNTWTSGAAIPTPVAFAAAAVLKNQIYLVGGYSGNNYSNAVGDNQIYNPATNSWSSGVALPTPTAQAAAAVVKNILYIFGGSNDGGPNVFNTVWAYNPKTNAWSQKAAMPTARCSVAATVENSIVYVVGGYASGQRLNTVEAYNPKTDTWTDEAPLLVGKSEPSVGTVGTKASGFTILAADGYNGSEDNGDNEAYNVGTNTWASLAPDPTGRNAACSGGIGTKLYIAGGALPLGGPAFTLTESYQLSNDTWTTLAPMPQAASVPGSAVYKKRLYCIGGYDAAQGGNFVNAVQIYQP